LLTSWPWFATNARAGLTIASFCLPSASRGHTLPYVSVRSDAFRDRGDPFSEWRDPPSVAFHGCGDRRDALILL